MNRSVQLGITLCFLAAAAVIYLSCGSSSDYLSALYSEEGEEDSRDRRKRRRGRVRTENKCENSDRCQSICDQNLDYTEDRRNCYLLSLDEIGDIEDSFDILKRENLEADDLQEIESRKFDLFIEYGARSWVKLMKGSYRAGDRDYSGRSEYEPSEAEFVLDWLLENSSIREAVGQSSYAKSVLYELLSVYGGGKNCTNKRMGGSPNLELSSNNLCKEAKALQDYLFEFSEKEEASSQEDLTYDAVHRVARDVCEEASVLGKNYSSSKDQKICLTLLYFESSAACGDILPRDSADKKGVSRFLFRNTRNSLFRDFESWCSDNLSQDVKRYFIFGNSHEPRLGSSYPEHDWSDYW